MASGYCPGDEAGFSETAVLVVAVRAAGAAPMGRPHTFTTQLGTGDRTESSRYAVGVTPTLEVTVRLKVTRLLNPASRQPAEMLLRSDELRVGKEWGRSWRF